MSDQNVFVKLVKKSDGLSTGEANCCGSVPQDSQETPNQCCGEQSADASSCCGSQESVDVLKGETSCCGSAIPEASQETSNQCDEKKPTDTSSCCS